MSLYNSFIGIDIGKFEFVVAVHGSNKVSSFKNDLSGFKVFFKEYKKELVGSLSIIETTGGHEMALLSTLHKRGFAAHRVDARKVKYFIQSYGMRAKTDKLDARGLALYGHERHSDLDLYTPMLEEDLELQQLAQRRDDLKKILVAEKNRLKSPHAKYIGASCSEVVEFIEKQLQSITLHINNMIEASASLKAKKAVLMSIPGIGEITANQLLIVLPELGSIDRRKIACLAGLAPKANDSGIRRGYRAVGRGRSGVRTALFMAAMAARNSNSSLKIFYNKLIENGKKKMVALTALMRKILVMANARVKELRKAEQCQSFAQVSA